MELIITQLKNIIHKFTQKFGVDFVRYDLRQSVSLRRAYFQKSNGINVVVDIGANKGSYAREIRDFGYTGRIISFEPLHPEFEILEKKTKSDPIWSCLNVAVGDTDAEVIINISGHRTSSSILPINQNHVMAMPSSASIGTQVARLMTLDKLLAHEICNDDKLHIKIDVQGYEMHVLRGATRTLQQAILMEVELSLIQLYEGASEYRSIIDFLDRNSYRLISLSPVFTDPKTGHLIQADAIFIRE